MQTVVTDVTNHACIHPINGFSLYPEDLNGAGFPHKVCSSLVRAQGLDASPESA